MSGLAFLACDACSDGTGPRSPKYGRLDERANRLSVSTLDPWRDVPRHVVAGATRRPPSTAPAHRWE
jgi:hypothetical protein